MPLSWFPSGKAGARELLQERGVALRHGAVDSVPHPHDRRALLNGYLQRLKDDEGVKLALAALLKQGGLDDRFLLSYGRRLWQLGRRAEALSFWDRLLGDKPTSLAYEQWVEVVLSSRAHVRPKLRPRLQAEAARGLRRYPKHAGLRVLKAQLGR